MIPSGTKNDGITVKWTDEKAAHQVIMKLDILTLKKISLHLSFFLFFAFFKNFFIIFIFCKLFLG